MSIETPDGRIPEADIEEKKVFAERALDNARAVLEQLQSVHGLMPADVVAEVVADIKVYDETAMRAKYFGSFLEGSPEALKAPVAQILYNPDIYRLTGEHVLSDREPADIVEELFA